jgi:glycosyltransferase involved in cell wall biosynthesis
MPPITALLHTANDALRLGRALETLLPCAEILIVDHGSADATRRIAREYGARIVMAHNQAPALHYLDLASHDWIFCIEPTESITESLQVTLFEWSALPGHRIVGSGTGVPAFSVFMREQAGERWFHIPQPQTRLIPRSWPRWRRGLPDQEPSAIALEGELLRFTLP